MHSPQPASCLSSQTGLLLIGHGTRQPQGVAEFMRLARRVRRLAGGTPVAACFLELTEPTIADGLAELAATGIREVVVAPVMLMAAGHIKQDIPQAVSAAAAAYPRLSIEQADHLGCHPQLLELSGRRYAQSIAAEATIAADETALVLVGRGSSDATAIAEMQSFARLRAQATALADLRTAFVAVAEPRLDDALEACATMDVRRVVVQPHLLFRGQVLHEILASVQSAAARHPKIQWLTARHLGPSLLVARTVLARVEECTRGV